jgi:uncharacterized protein YjeT (DUF2065 family)
MALMSFIINAIAVLMIADGVFILVYPKHIEQLVKDVFPKLKIRQIAIAELVVGTLILVVRTASRAM